MGRPGRARGKREESDAAGGQECFGDDKYRDFCWLEHSAERFRRSFRRISEAPASARFKVASAHLSPAVRQDRVAIGVHSDGPTPDQIPEMIQSMLLERFQLKAHREKRELPAYVITAGKPPFNVELRLPDTTTPAPKGSGDVQASGSAAGASVDLGNGCSAMAFSPATN